MPQTHKIPAENVELGRSNKNEMKTKKAKKKNERENTKLHTIRMENRASGSLVE